ncbi:AraC family transcriptional regulator [Vibrio sp. 99-8-1]|uniref:AraC family transcriptional regulator n=1 Tax=Vibrio sp. 99-8-1 TaxID=2607602 RepID=UPI0014939536|nr:AraC family transcriptional regulator [Vibrio sp. 99-8-1]NOI66811.1 AraC family transcriptional regulator [Vibrio sp. 99-8-1]
MKSPLDKVPTRPGMSWRYKHCQYQSLQQPYHHHSEFEIALHIGAEGVLQLNQQQFVIESNCLLLLPPRTSHCYDQTAKDGVEANSHFIWFRADWLGNMAFSCEEFRHLNDRLKSARYGLRFSEETAQQAVKLLSELDCGKAKLAQLAAFIELLSLLCQDTSTVPLLVSQPMLPTAKETDEVSKIEKLARFIDSHFAYPLTLSQLADHMCMSQSSVHRFFILHFGETFTQRLKKTRLSYSAQWLVDTDDSIAVISQKSGYQNQANFNRQFKQYHGLTPREYRHKFKLGLQLP